MKNVKENIMRFVFILAACVSIAAVALICIFLFANGIPAIAKIGPLKFLGRPHRLLDQQGRFPVLQISAAGQKPALRWRDADSEQLSLLPSVLLARMA